MALCIVSGARLMIPRNGTRGWSSGSICRTQTFYHYTLQSLREKKYQPSFLRLLPMRTFVNIRAILASISVFLWCVHSTYLFLIYRVRSIDRRRGRWPTLFASTRHYPRRTDPCTVHLLSLHKISLIFRRKPS